MALFQVAMQSLVSLAGLVLAQPTGTPPVATFPDDPEAVPSAESRDAPTKPCRSIWHWNRSFIAVHTQPESAAGAILPALVLSGLGGAAVALADRQGAFRYGVPQAITTGMLEQGVAWTIWNQARASWLEQWSDETVATLIWGATSAGAVAGGIIGANTRTTPGQASYVGSVGLWGGVVGGLLSAAFTGDEERQDDAGMLGGALGLNAGAALGLATVGSVSPSIARVDCWISAASRVEFWLEGSTYPLLMIGPKFRPRSA